MPEQTLPNYQTDAPEQNVAHPGGKQTKNPTTLMIVLIMIILLLTGILMYALFQSKPTSAPLLITSYQECVDAGYPIMESYPPQCATSDGQTFVGPTTASDDAETFADDELTADWVTFQNEFVRIKYPPTMEIQRDEADAVTLSLWGESQREGTELSDAIVLRFEPHRTTQTPLQFAEGNLQEAQTSGLSELILPIKDTTISSYSGVTYTVRGLGEYKYTVIQAQPGVLLQIIDNTVDPNDIGYHLIVNTILSNLQLLSEEDNTSDMIQ